MNLFQLKYGLSKIRNPTRVTSQITLHHNTSQHITFSLIAWKLGSLIARFTFWVLENFLCTIFKKFHLGNLKNAQYIITMPLKQLVAEMSQNP